MRFRSVTGPPLGLQLLLMTVTWTMTSPVQAQRWEDCGGDDVTRYIARDVDVSFQVLANYRHRHHPHQQQQQQQPPPPPASPPPTPRLRAQFNLTNRGSSAVRRGRWQIYLSSFRRIQLDDHATMLGNSGLKARFSVPTSIHWRRQGRPRGPSPPPNGRAKKNLFFCYNRGIFKFYVICPQVLI